MSTVLMVDSLQRLVSLYEYYAHGSLPTERLVSLYDPKYSTQEIRLRT